MTFLFNNQTHTRQGKDTRCCSCFVPCAWLSLAWQTSRVVFSACALPPLINPVWFLNQLFQPSWFNCMHACLFISFISFANFHINLFNSFVVYCLNNSFLCLFLQIVFIKKNNRSLSFSILSTWIVSFLFLLHFDCFNQKQSKHCLIFSFSYN